MAVYGVFLLFNSLLYTIRLRDINKIRENTQSVCFFVNIGGLRVLSYRVFIYAVSLSLHVGLVE